MMTAPLTPPECDLQDFPFMPLHVARLRDSDLAGEESPEACWYAVLLWAAAWHQLPAGSLPDNDPVLARLIGLGRDVRTFRKNKAGAMRGFVLCDDGRLYHPVVAEQAIVAWNGKLQQRWRTECARIKKANQRNETDLPTPTFEEFLSRGAADPSPENVPEDVPGDMAKSPPGQCLQEKETGKGTGRLLERSDDLFVAPTEPAPTEVSNSPGYPDLFEKAWAAYPHVKGRSSKKLTHGFWKKLPAMTREALPAAVARYAKDGREPKMECGAQAMERWVRDEKFGDWLGGSSAGPMGADWADARWAIAVDLWRTERAWDAGLGPTPGQPGCRVPPHLLVEPAKPQVIGRVA